MIVVFDGYPTNPGYQSTKVCSSLQSATKVVFSSSTMVTIVQENVLANDHNNSTFISMLMTQMADSSIEVKQAYEDADMRIVNTTIFKDSEFVGVIITAEDVNILILLTVLGTSSKNIFRKVEGVVNVQSEG